MKGLGINKAAGILDIIASVLYFFAVYIIERSYSNNVRDFLTNGNLDFTETKIIQYIFLGFAAVCLALHIIGLVLSKKQGMKIAGNILGIIGHSIYFLMGAEGGSVAMILTILSAVFTLKDNKIPNNHTAG